MTSSVPEAWRHALSQSDLFGVLDPNIRDYLTAELVEREVTAGAILVRQGEVGESLYLIVDGQVEVVLEQEEELAITALGPGSVVGEIALGLGGERSATVRALTPTTVLELTRDAFDKLIDNNPQLMAPLIDVLRSRLRTVRIAEYVRTIFGELSTDTLKDLESNMKWVHLVSGKELFRQGDEPDGAYIVAVGRVRVVIAAPDGSEQVLAEAGPGKWIGEMALLTRSVRSATVYAVRDTELVWLSQSAFDELIGNNRTALMETTRLLVTRLQGQLGSRQVVLRDARSFVLVPASTDVDVDELSRDLSAALAVFGSVQCLTAERVDASMGKTGISGVSDNHPANLRLGPWLMDQEERHDYTIYLADAEWSNWSARAIRHADHVLLVANAWSNPAVGETERRMNERFALGRAPKRGLVLLQPPGQGNFPGTRRWLDSRDYDDHFHLRPGETRDIARLARRLTGRAVSLVLGGGGSRGYAHVGVIRVFEELGIPIDAIGGTSMGALVAGALAMGLRSHEIMPALRAIFDSLIDLTLPLVSVASGRRVVESTEQMVGSLDIEDLAIPLFCVSTNLTRRHEVVHQRGAVSLAVRASGSMPGVYPPVPWRGDLLVDGGLSDNLPVETMAALHPGSIIAVDVMPDVDLVVGDDLPVHLSGWRVAWNRLNPLRERIDMPNILSILVRSVTTASHSARKEQQVGELAALYLKPQVKQRNMLDFKAAPSMAEQGYHHTVEAIGNWWREARDGILGRSPE